MIERSKCKAQVMPFFSVLFDQQKKRGGEEKCRNEEGETKESTMVSVLWLKGLFDGVIVSTGERG